MAKLFTWMRPSDEALFQSFFDRVPSLRVQNARTSSGEMEGLPNGLLITGGADIAASFLEQEIPDPSPIEEDADPSRDGWEFRALHEALSAGLPILAICKGVQVLNVALGGTLLLDIRGHNLAEQRDGNVQELRFAEQVTHRFPFVNSSHHQALDRLGDGLEVEAWHADDGIIEQVRLRGEPFVFGVQYHPERNPGYAPLFDDFLNRLL